jgi:hypothetical protein
MKAQNKIHLAAFISKAANSVMNTKIKFCDWIFLFLFLILVNFSSCKKLPFDYRNKYVGTWNFHYISKTWSANNSIFQSTSDTGNYEGKIFYSLTELKRDYITVEFSPNKKVDIKIDKQGNFSECSTGNFSDNNSISFSYNSSKCGGGLGGGHIHKVSGTKY